MQKEITITIDKEYIQAEARSCIDRNLTGREYDDVCEGVREGLSLLVQDKIHEVIDFNEMLKSNKGAEKKFPHFKVLNRNVNAFRKEFENFGVFKTEEYARRFIDKDIVPFDEWKIVCVDKGNVEKEVYKINR